MVGAVSTSDAEYKQALIFDKESPLYADIRIVKTDKKGKSTEGNQLFNLSDLDVVSVAYKIQKDVISVIAETKKGQKFIKEFENDSFDRFSGKVTFFAGNIGEAREAVTLLKKIIPLAEQKQLRSAPKLTDRFTAIQLLKKVNKTLTDKSGDIIQHFETACTASLKVTRSGKGVTDEYYTFQVADLNDKKIVSDIKGSFFEIGLSTNNNQKVISYFKNDQRQNYTNSITLLSDNLEDFRYLPEALKKVIADCKALEKSRVPAGSLSATMAWLEKQIPRLESDKVTINQSLTVSKDCSMKFTEERSDVKKSGELVYEAGLKDLNVNAVNFDISGKNVFVILMANGKEKLIKTYKDGTPGNYTNEIRIQIDDVSIARDVTEGFKAVIKGCSGK
ncbi:MAG: hypothetical protein LRY55_14615 [Leadbetterella sp.]|nr:hypothetical protein [Leadbetterella sp.]